jgi:UDP-N-acetylmuramoyl-tripeptide--D-alanyl-D-alanine ligase
MKVTFKNIVVHLLTLEAKFLLRRRKPTIVAVTGSVGKTSTKDAIYTVLKGHLHTRKSQKSFNSDIGVALSVLGLQNGWNSPLAWLRNLIDGAFIAFFSSDYPNVLVLEMGVDRPGDMARMASWVKPDVVVLTRFPDVPVHVEYFKTPEDVVCEKMQLVYALKPDGVVIYNHDDALIKSALEAVRQQAIGFSRYAPSQYTVSGDVVQMKDGKPAGVRFNLEHINEVVTVSVDGVLGVQSVYTAAAAAAVGSHFGISLQDVATALASHPPAPGRMRVIAGKHDTVLIDDTYNSSPVAAEKAVETMAELKTGGRKVLVLGDMLELGRFSVREHERLGEQVARVADVLVTVGVRAHKIAEGARGHGIAEKAVHEFDDALRAADALIGMIEPGDVILVKASQGIRAEKIVKRLMARPDEAAQLLVRQEDMWEIR